MNGGAISHQFNSLLNPLKNGQEKGGQTWDKLGSISKWGGKGTCPNPTKLNKVPWRLPFKNKTIQASSGLSKMFLVFRSTNVTMYALWVKINKFNHCHAFIIQSLAFLIKPDFRTSCKLELFSKTILADFKIFIFFWLFSVFGQTWDFGWRLGLFWDFFTVRGGGVPVPTFLHQKNGNFSGKNNMLRIA